MKLKHHIKILSTLFLKQLPMSILGLIVVPIAYPFRKNGKLPNWAWSWGNDEDGLYTDNPAYRPSWAKEGSFLDAFYWLAIRNPARNFSVKMGYYGDFVKEIKIIQPGLIDVSPMEILVTMNDGTEYPFKYIFKRVFGEYYLMFKYGWKNWVFTDNDRPHTLEEIKGRYVQFVCYPQLRKKFK